MENAWNLEAAATFIKFNAIDNEDYLAADNDTQTKLLNVSKTTLVRKFRGLIIPDNAVFLFAATLGAAYNDTNKLSRQGVSNFSISGISFSFRSLSAKDLTDLITQDVAELISEANGGIPVSVGRSVKWATL